MPSETPEPRGFPWGWVAIVGIVVAALAAQSQPNATTTATAIDPLASSSTSVAPVAATVEEPIADATLALAARHAGLALGADGLDGAAVYSVNCWAALDRRFALAHADRCAAFDALASAHSDDPAVVAGWFAEADASARYLAATTKYAAAVGEAPARLEGLRVAAAVQTVKLVVAKVPKMPAATDVDGEAAAEIAESESVSNVAANGTATDW